MSGFGTLNLRFQHDPTRCTECSPTSDMSLSALVVVKGTVDEVFPLDGNSKDKMLVVYSSYLHNEKTASNTVLVLAIIYWSTAVQ